MKVKTITLYSNDLKSQKSFYQDTLGLAASNETEDSFSIEVGWTKMTFKKSSEKFCYHYCFLIPSNKLEEALGWFGSRLDIVPIEDNFTYFFESWNARSFYFYDGNGNLAECIVRYDLKNTSNTQFTSDDLLCINEIGMPSTHIPTLNDSLINEMGSHFWKGDMERFATNGSQEGLFLLVNNLIKKTWFPSSLPTQSSPFQATIETKKGLFDIEFVAGELKISKKQ
jgi:catechol 2,3-dioxygenase-like lactoylglutathione lyase family enzyme